MAFGLEAVMPIEFQVPTLRIQATKRLDERQMEQIWKEGLLLLEESQIHAMTDLERKQRETKAFVEQHCHQPKKQFTIGKLVLVFQTKMGSMLGKLQFHWTGPVWIVNNKNISSWYIIRRDFTKMGKWFPA